jgi:hypothetical protein
MAITLDGTTGITTPEIISTAGPVVINASAPDNSMVVDASGNVGVGTTAPQGKMEVRNSSSGVVTNALTISNFVQQKMGFFSN